MSIFREYDIRGIYEKDLNEESVFKIGFLLANELREQNLHEIYIGYDARVHSKILFSFLARGFISNGIKVYNLGLVPTPVTYFACFNGAITSAIMITGSHNPPQYNGFKITINKSPFYGKDIKNLAHKMQDVKFKELDSSSTNTNKTNVQKDTPDSQITSKTIFQFIDSNISHIGNMIFNAPNMLEKYIDFLCNEFKDLENLKEEIAFDCGNGAASTALMPILKKLKIKNKTLFISPDGNFPNHHPDPSDEKNLVDLKNLIERENIKVGIAFDGDADRVALISQNYNFKGDELAILFARDIAKNIKNPTIIGEVKCSMNMYNEIDKIGTSVMYKTGHSNLKIKLKELNAQLACEMSGHIFFNDRYFGYDDAIYGALRILELILKDKHGISGLQQDIQSLPKLFSTNEEHIHVSDENKFSIMEKLEDILNKIKNGELDSKNSAFKDFNTDLKDSKDFVTLQQNFPKIKKIITIDGVRVIFENGWGLVRASNTTPVLVTRFESINNEDLELYKHAMLGILDNIK